MNMPFCHNYTHPTIALVLRELAKGARTGIELSKVLRLHATQARSACDWMHSHQLIRVVVWSLTSGKVRTRVWGLADGLPDAAKPIGRRTLRKRRATAAAMSFSPASVVIRITAPVTKIVSHSWIE